MKNLRKVAPILPLSLLALGLANFFGAPALVQYVIAGMGLVLAVILLMFWKF